ncbi:MAG: methyltransferase domain-containing protein [Hoeflea sp.]|uniref:methyltransferase domain-containing protein n=1 Tax=Hoeflea sp. TaxID=1940281 RepID=UPI003EF58780
MTDTKYTAELEYWSDRFKAEGTLANSHYRDLMLSLSGKSPDFFDNLIVGDFGSGPRGSLEWMDNAKQRYCIDVLAEEYRQFGVDTHKAKYIRSTEQTIPLQTSELDVLFSVNAIDHAEDVQAMINESFRVVKPGGSMFFSINLDEPPSPAEPNTITRQDCQAWIVSRLDDVETAISNWKKGEDKYLALRKWANDGTEPPEYNGTWGVCWLRGRKR